MTRSFGAGLLLVALAVAAYALALGAGFIWDDDHYVTENPTLRDLDGLRYIWFEIGAVPQYYPLVHTTFWVEYRLWGLSPRGFHAVNVLLHALNGVLLWRLLRRLRLPGAWVAAAVFLLHPVHVESVAWITERKNVLSTLFYLLSALAWLRYRDAEGSRASRLYAATLLLFAGALLSKTVTATLPVALLIVLWWKRERLGREAWSTVPMFVMGAVSGLLTVWMERQVVGAAGAHWSLDPIERCLVAGRALWFYLGKLLWPHPLIFAYPRWTIDATSVAAWLFPSAAVAVGAGLWAARRRLGRGPLAAALYFAVTLGPALGFVNVFPMRYSFVADHFQYLASIGPIALVVAVLANGWRRQGGLGRRAGILFCAVVLLALGTLTRQQTRIYADAETLWEATVLRNPRAHLAHNNLGALRLRASERTTDPAERDRLLREAWTHFEAAARLGSAEAYNNLGIVLQRRGNQREAIEQFRAALQILPNFADAHNNLGISVAELGRVEEAAGHFAEAVRIDPEMASARFNLARALIQLGRLDEALPHLEEAVRLEPRDPGLRQLRDRIRAELR